MTYTLWHRQHLIGETEFEQDRGEGALCLGERLHLAGAFYPTDYGRRLLPRLCGMLTAGFDLKEELLRRGLPTDDPPADIVEQLFETTEAGAHIIDIGRVLSEVELRDPGGVTLTVASMAFIELAELASLSRRLGTNEKGDFEGVPSGAAEFLVSVTLGDLSSCRRTMPLQ
ncbi:MAG TPA: hypothetical protein VFD67_09165 [Gemmatimonadaceae bacterium]|nr:hypothetical protein [Gemmatimonadaceae bacterium]